MTEMRGMIPRRKGTMTVEQAKQKLQKQVIVATPVSHWVGDIKPTSGNVPLFSYRFSTDALLLSPELYVSKITLPDTVTSPAMVWANFNGSLVASIPLTEGATPLFFAQFSEVKKYSVISCGLYLPDVTELTGVSVGFLFRPIAIPVKEDKEKEQGNK